MFNKKVRNAETLHLDPSKALILEELENCPSKPSPENILCNGENPSNLSSPVADQFVVQRFQESGIDDRGLNPHIFQPLCCADRRVDRGTDGQDEHILSLFQ